MARQWTATPNASWMTVTPTAGTISTEMDTITVQVNTGGLAADSYTGSIRIVLTGTNRHTQTATVPITVVVTNETTSAPSIALNPTALSFSGTAGGTNPSSKTVNLSNPTGWTLTWSLAESASWLTLNVASGTTTSETDQIVASVTVQRLAAGTYSTMINVTAAGASNSPRQIPVTLALSQATTTTGSLTLSWTGNTETDLAGYKVYVGTQPGIYNAPNSIGNVISYTVASLSTGAPIMQPSRHSTVPATKASTQRKSARPSTKSTCVLLTPTPSQHNRHDWMARLSLDQACPRPV